MSLYCARDERRGELRFLIDLWGYCVLDGDVEVADVSIIVGKNGRVEMNGNFIGQNLTPIELRGWLRIGAARKRGPRKQVVVAAVVATA